ncbi:MAG: type II toxin-antitoxin system VapC family toxin [Hyphomicrobiaceae bacterium]|nr:type II toxin-antitoxin system VapC family toxin [Hyphomicrobiaceae bacterium]
MIAIDTNIVVRIIVDDEPRQVAKARRLLEESQVYVLTTALLESEWVLRSLYGLDRQRMKTSLMAFCSLPNVVLEDEDRVRQALDLHAEGLDFADALHLAGAKRADAFATFDKSLRAKAGKFLDGLVVREP